MKKGRTDTHHVSVRFTKNQYENKIKRIVEERDLFNSAEAIRFCLEYTYSGLFPAYMEKKIQNQPGIINQPPAVNKKAKEKSHLIESINGIFINETSETVAQVSYKTYTEETLGEITVEEKTIPLYELGQETVKYQYRDALGNIGEEAKKRIEEIMSKK